MAPSDYLAIFYGTVMLIAAVMWFGFNLKKA